MGADGGSVIASDRERQRLALLASWRGFLATPAAVHAGVLLLLAAVAALRYAEGVFDPQPRPDELAYFVAFERVRDGASPYHGDYFYLPLLAIAGARAVELVGEAAVLAALRAANVLGAAVMVWWSLGWSGLALRRRLLLAIGYLVVAEPIRYGLLWGNLSLALGGSVVWALLAWDRRPLLAGAVLGAGVAIKPLAPAAIAALAIHRSPLPPAHGAWTKRLGVSGAQLRAAIAAVVLGALLVLVPPGLGTFLELGGGRPWVTRNVALHRLLHCFGIDVPALWLSAAVALAGALLVRRLVLPPLWLYCYAVSLALLATPLVWSHTLLLTLPMQVVALAIAARRWRSRPTGEAAAHARARLLLEGILVLGAVLAAELAQGVGGIDDQPLWIQGLVLLPPVLAPTALALYVVRRTAPL
jgi:hypothetical protein